MLITVPLGKGLADAIHEEPDLTSPLGFEDDAEVLNACLCLAGLDDWCVDDWCVRPEDYDDA